MNFKKVLSYFAIVCTLCLSLFTPVEAGITGKIAGRVIDKDTGEPLPGARPEAGPRREPVGRIAPWIRCGRRGKCTTI